MGSPVSREVADVALKEFIRCMRQARQATDLQQRNLDAMQAAIEVADKMRQEQLPILKLTPRQYEVLELAAKSRGNKQIALDMGLAPSTVRTHLHDIYVALGVVNRAQASFMLLRGQVMIRK